MPSLEQLLGAHVVTAKGDKVPTASLAANDCIALYFSAHWYALASSHRYSIPTLWT